MKNRVRCTVTGLWFNANQNRMRDLIRQYGSEEALVKGYVSRLGKRLLAEGKTEAEIKKLVEAGEITSKADAPKATSGKRGRPAGSKNREASTEIPEAGEESETEGDSEVENFLQKGHVAHASKKV